MKFIQLLPLGNADRRLLKELIPAVWDAFHVPVEVREYPLNLSMFYDENRGQYNSTLILSHLKEQCQVAPHLSPRMGETLATVLAILPHDLFIPILTFVFGEAELSGRHAVVSYHRLENEHYGLPSDPALLARRLQKEALHELGHTVGLLHCHSQECVMRTSTSVEEIDVKGSGFCADCYGLMRRRR